MKMITDVHTHSDFSFDGLEALSSILEKAYQKGVAFYGVSEHIEYEYFFADKGMQRVGCNEEEYFHQARHLQEDYEGAMNVLIGLEFGYDDREEACTMYENIYKKYKPDFVVNSIHTIRGWDWYNGYNYGEKRETYLKYLSLVRQSLDVPYPYDVVGHIGYVTRYAPYEDRSMTLAEYGEQIDDILLTIIKKDKILETNSRVKDGVCLPTEEILRRYYELGGRKVSFASDTHDSTQIANKREEVVALLKEIGFTYIIVPCKGEHIKVEI